MQDLPDFDPRVLERSAENAYRRANAIFTGCVAGGVVLGALFGATPLTPIGAHWPIPQAFGFATMLLGALLGGVVGYVVGDTRSALCRPRAAAVVVVPPQVPWSRTVVRSARRRGPDAVNARGEVLRGRS